MKNLLILLFILFISNCSLNKVVKHHGVHFLEKKQQKLILSNSNKNDIVTLLGPPSTKSTFDNDIYIYIEKKTSSSKLTKLGKKKLIRNNVLVLEVNNKGILVSKVDNEEINLDKGDIILEVNREIVETTKSFISIVDKYKKTGRSSLLLKVQREEEISWITIKFIDN